MKIIGWHLLRLAAEAASDLNGGVVESIRRDKARGRLLLILGSRKGKRYLVIGARGPQAAFFWTRGKAALHTFERYSASEALNRLRGTRLHDISIPNADRWARLEFTKLSKNDGEIRGLSLVVTWTGAAGNARLIDPETDTILEAVWPENKKTIGSHFTPPQPPSLIDWRGLTFPEFLSLRRATSDQSLSEWLQRKVWGLDSALTDEIGRRIGEIKNDPPSKVQSTTEENWNQFRVMIKTLRDAISPETAIVLNSDQPDISQITLSSPDAASEPDSEDPSSGRRLTLAHALALIDQHQSAGAQSASLRDRVCNAITKHAAKAHRRLVSVQKAAARGDDLKRMQREADMLAAQRHLLQKGAQSISLPDWDSGDEITIKLNPAKSPQENIDNAYRRARTTANAIKNAHQEISALSDDDAQWQKLKEEVLDPETGDDRLMEMASLCGIAVTEPVKRSGPTRHVPYREFLLGETQLWVGKSRRDNDELTLHHTRPYDLFLHAQGCPGSHVILRRQDRSRPPNPQLVAQAAEIAAYFSKAKHSGLVPVSYTEVRYVRKPRKAPAGLVRIEREETVMVKPKPPPGYHEEG